MTTIAERLALLDHLHKMERDIMERKAHDYSGKEDCNKNIRACELLGIASTESGILVRMMDKFQRITQLLKSEAKVKDESIYDTIHDFRNYLAILYDVYKERKIKEHNGKFRDPGAPSMGSSEGPSGHWTVERVLDTTDGR